MEEAQTLTWLWLLALILAIAPGVVLLWYIRHVDRYEPEPWRNIGLAFLAGVVAVVATLIIATPLAMVKIDGFVGTMWQSFIVAALVEELCKGAMGYVFMWQKRDFNEVMDGIVYFGMAHMGFAITENLAYIFLQSGGNIAQALMTAFARATTAVPMHVLVGMIMGYHLGAARFASDTPAMRYRHGVQAFAIPILLHGFYDLASFNDPSQIEIETALDIIRAGFGSALFYVAVVAVWLFLLPRVQRAQEASPWKPPEWPTLPAAPEPCEKCGTHYPLGSRYCPGCAEPIRQPESYYESAPGVH